jgi:hypothetical protein
MLVRGHKPGSRVVRDARLRPLFERGDESILREVLDDSILQTASIARSVSVATATNVMLQSESASRNTHCHESCFYLAAAPDNSFTC